jgi:hypothetical protein
MEELLKTITWLLAEGFEVGKDEFRGDNFEFWGETKGLEYRHTIDNFQEVDGILYCRINVSVVSSDYIKSFTLRFTPFTIDSVKHCLEEI